jgi:hypothetical protein
MRLNSGIPPASTRIAALRRRSPQRTRSDDTSGKAAREAFFDSGFDIVGKDVPAAEDQHVAQAAADIELAVAQETEVAGPQIGPLRRLARDVRLEYLLRLVGQPPIAGGPAGAVNPDLADGLVRHGQARIRIDDAHVHVRPWSAAADECVSSLRWRRADGLGAAALHPASAGGHAERVLGESISGDCALRRSP